MELSAKKKEKLLKALQEGKITDETSLTVFEMVEGIQERLDEEIPQIKDVISRVRGEKGEQGIQGEKGEKGDIGEQGEKGDQGDPGKDGKDGRDQSILFRGPKGDKGEQGNNGENGNDGLDGSPDTAEQIANKLETLIGDKRLDVSAIKGLSKKLGKISDDILDRAIGILDQRSSFSIQKAEQLRTDINTKVTGWGTHNIYVQPTAPPNPSINDLWVDIS